MRSELTALRKSAKVALRERLRKGNRLGHLAKEGDVTAIAGFLMTTIYGNAIRAKEGQSRATLQKTIEIVVAAIPFVSPPDEG